MKALWRDPEYRAKTIAAQRCGNADPSVKRAKSLATHRRLRDPKAREILALSASKLWKERRSEMIKKLRLAQRNPAERKRKSLASRKMWQDPTYRLQIAKTRSQNRTFSSGDELNLCTALVSARIRFVPQFRIARSGITYSFRDTTRYLGQHCFDIGIPQWKLVIEVCGCYWYAHSCLSRKNLSRKRSQGLHKTALQLAAARRAGWHAIRVFACQVKDEKERRTVIERLRKRYER